VRNLNNSLGASAAAGESVFFNVLDDVDVDPSPNVIADTFTCELCHRIDPAQGFFGSDGGQTPEGGTQNMKVPHVRYAYTKIGMFGISFGIQGFDVGDQIRGYGFLHDGTVPTLLNFNMGFDTLTQQQRIDLASFMHAFPTDLAPIVGQQVTLDAGNAAAVGPRIALLIARATAPFTSLVLGGAMTECDLVVKGSVGGSPRGWVLSGGVFLDDVGGSIGDAALRALATSEGPLTYTCAPPGSGVRMGINADRDSLLDGLDNCAGVANDAQLDNDADGAGDACDQDDDDDRLLDAYETGTGVFVSEFDTGSDPFLADSDGDGVADGLEVEVGTDPNDAASFPALVPALSEWTRTGLALAMLFATLSWMQVRRRRVSFARAQSPSARPDRDV
jgi:hypothetical protein